VIRWFAVVLVLALVGVACTSGDGDETTTSGAAGTETTSTTVAGDETTSVVLTDEGVGVDVGVDADTKTIKLGILADLTGLFAPLVIDITDAQRAYWDDVNATGGLRDGWQVELVIVDTNLDVEQHLEAYEKIKSDVVAIGQSSGTSANLAALPRYVEDNILFIPLSWYSGWAIPQLDSRLAFEQNTNYCIEAMNLLGFINDLGGTKLALATFGDDYGLDNAAGVRMAASFYDMEVVYDGAGAVVPGQDQTLVIAEIINSGADWVYVATNASLLQELFSGAVRGGFEGMWTGSLPSYDFRLLDTAIGAELSERYFQSAYQVPWGTDVSGMWAMQGVLRESYPSRRPSDGFVIGWVESIAMREVLEVAIAEGDLTRQGVIDAANSVTDLDFRGLAPPQSYVGTPNDFVQRQLAIYQPDLAAYVAAGGADQTLSQEGGGTTGSRLVADFTTWQAAEAFTFTQPCSPP
jgi:ABC-type branched-subunit amino acid transport system substrate-binding protein